MPAKRYRIYIDESGDHAFNKLDQPDKRYLGLSGIIIETEHYRTHFFPQLESLKQKHFPHNPDEPVILHRTDIINSKGSFWRLRDLRAKDDFDNELLVFLKNQSYHVITAVIDKKANVERHGPAAFHPYHHCLTAILERYCGFLNYFHAEGDVMVESRGGREDHQIKEAYQTVYVSGTQFRTPEYFQRVLTTKEIKLKQKTTNIAGLQIADLLAYPSKQEVLVCEGRISEPGEIFGKQVVEILQGKYNKKISQDRIEGYGRIFLK